MHDMNEVIRELEVLADVTGKEVGIDFKPAVGQTPAHWEASLGYETIRIDHPSDAPMAIVQKIYEQASNSLDAILAARGNDNEREITQRSILDFAKAKAEEYQDLMVTTALAE